LFVGIDRYAAPGISWLSSASRDAVALHALFGDTFGTTAELLTDDQATAAAVRDKLAQLAATSTPDDLVVVAFSGHGSPSHCLVTYDADPTDINRTCLPLDELADLVSAIPAATLLCVLDCCFSGGMGAKVFTPPVRVRDLTSEEEALQRIAGDGRLAFTASAANEPAWESSILGHGLLTYHLLRALQGARRSSRPASSTCTSCWGTSPSR
jgi:ATP-dependent DNA helicase